MAQKLTRWVPPGFPLRTELTLFTVGNVCAFLYSLTFLFRFWNSYRDLFVWALSLIHILNRPQGGPVQGLRGQIPLRTLHRVGYGDRRGGRTGLRGPLDGLAQHLLGHQGPRPVMDGGQLGIRADLPQPGPDRVHPLCPADYHLGHLVQ